MAAESFGRRQADTRGQALTAPLSFPSSSIAPAPGQWPLFTFSLAMALAAIFAVQMHAAHGHLDVAALLAEGASSRSLVLHDGQIWRLLTAALLHGSLGHLAGNLTALLIAGYYIERQIGRGFMAAIYFLATLGGEIGSLCYSDLPSVGASGAIMGLVAAMLTISVHDGVAQKRARQMRRYSLLTMIPALLPSASGGAVVDIGAHAGGALAGLFGGLVVLSLWHDEEEYPHCPAMLSGFGLGGFLLSLVALGLASPPAAEPVPEAAVEAAPALTIIPPWALPHDTDQAVAQSEALVAHYPGDPRARLWRAVYFLRRRDAADAEPQLEEAMDLIDSHATIYPALFRQQVEAVWAATLLLQGRIDAAHEHGRDVCNSHSDDPLLTAMRETLQRYKGCG